jgi:hypothetical protein
MRYTKKYVEDKIEDIQLAYNVDISQHSENGRIVITNKSQSINYVYGLTYSEAFVWLCGLEQGLEIVVSQGDSRIVRRVYYNK